MPSRPPKRGSNGPGSPLRSYRMSMLAHGFVDEADREYGAFVLDESDPMSYSVVRLHGPPLGMAAWIVGGIVALAIIVLVLVLG